MKKIANFAKRWISVAGIVLLLVIFMAASQVKFGAQYFLTWSNVKNILLQTSAVAVVAIGQSVLLIGGNFDLSLGRVVCLTSCVGALLMRGGVNPLLAIAVMFAVGLAVGAANGLMVAYIRVPTMIATLGTQFICYGLAKLLTQAMPIAPLPDAIAWVGRGYLAEMIPVCALITLVLYLAAQFIMTRTRVGRNVFALGSSQEAAFYSGIHVKKTVFFSFVLAAVLATFGGIMLMSRLNSASITNGQNYEFDAIIAAIIGGVSLSGGKGHVMGTLCGALFLSILFIGFSQMGVDSYVQDVLKGIVLVLAVVLDVLGNRKKA